MYVCNLQENNFELSLQYSAYTTGFRYSRDCHGRRQDFFQGWAN